MPVDPVSQVSTTPPLYGATFVDDMNGALASTLIALQAAQRGVGRAWYTRPKSRYALWLPTATFATPGTLSVAYTVRLGSYYKIGRMVWIKIGLTFIPTNGTAAGDLQVTGFPYLFSAEDAFDFRCGTVRWSGITKANYQQVCLRASNGGSNIILQISGSGQTTTTVQVGDVPSGGTVNIRAAGVVFTEK